LNFDLIGSEHLVRDRGKQPEVNFGFGTRHAMSRLGQRASILARIFSAIAIASVMAHSTAGDGRPSQVASFRAANGGSDQQDALAALCHERSLASSLYIRHTGQHLRGRLRA
jgi:hypothetical protein